MIPFNYFSTTTGTSSALLQVLIWWFGVGKVVAWTCGGILFVSPKGLNEKERREVLLLLRQVPTLKRVKWEGRKGKKPICIYMNAANLNVDSLRLVAAGIVSAAASERNITVRVATRQ